MLIKKLNAMGKEDVLFLGELCGDNPNRKDIRVFHLKKKQGCTCN